MAVFTALDAEAMANIIQPYGLGQLLDFHGVSEGIENTNYAISTSLTHFAQEYGHEKQGDYFLTVFEALPEHDLNFHLLLLEKLYHAHIPVSLPIRDYDGKRIQWINGKPAVLCPRIPGQHLTNPTAENCKEVGVMLAKIHQNTTNIDYQSGGIRGIEWFKSSLPKLLNSLPHEERESCQIYFDAYLNIGNQLPQCIIHGDLFKDNVLFDQGELTGVIDFFNAGKGYAIFDLAICCIDWCITDNTINKHKMLKLIEGYETIRLLTSKEKQQWGLMLIISALRFWLSRTLSIENIKNQPGELNIFKSPEPYKELYQYCVATQNSLTIK